MCFRVFRRERRLQCCQLQVALLIMLLWLLKWEYQSGSYVAGNQHDAVFQHDYRQGSDEYIQLLHDCQLLATVYSTVSQCQRYQTIHQYCLTRVNTIMTVNLAIWWSVTRVINNHDHPNSTGLYVIITGKISHLQHIFMH